MCVCMYVYVSRDTIRSTLHLSTHRQCSHTHTHKHRRTLPCKHIAGQKVHIYTASDAQNDLAGNSPGSCGSSDLKDRTDGAIDAKEDAAAAKVSRSCVCVCVCMCICLERWNRCCS